MSRNLLLGQSGGPTPVINASLAGVLTEIKRRDGYDSVIGMAHGIEGVFTEQFYRLTEVSDDFVQKMVTTPSSILGSCRRKLKEEDYQEIFDKLIRHDIHGLIYIGGNDSMDTCHRLACLSESSSYDLQVIGVPKTIDNDLVSTDHTPGFGSAAKFIALCTRDAGLDLEAMETFDDVVILEAMGRNAGWLPASAGLAKEHEAEAPHLIYVPEIPFDEDKFLEDIQVVHKALGRVFVIVGEGIRYPNGEMVGLSLTDSVSQDAFGHSLVALTAGVASYLSSLVSRRLKLRSRFLRPGVIGRAFSACVSEIDRREAFAVGQEAARLLIMGISDCMVSLERLSNDPYSFRCVSAPLADVANHEKLLPREYFNEAGTMITHQFSDYALPLIDGPLPPVVRLKR